MNPEPLFPIEERQGKSEVFFIDVILNVNVPSHSRGLHYVAFKGPFQSKTSYDSVILLLLNNAYFTARTAKLQRYLTQHYASSGLKKRAGLNVSNCPNDQNLIAIIHIARPDWTDARRHLLTKKELESNFSLEKLQLYFDHATQVIAR